MNPQMSPQMNQPTNQPAAGQTPQTSQSPGAQVGAQGDILMRRLLDIELLLGVNEWWLLGTKIPAAKLLSEVTSLLTVARAELDSCLREYCDRARAEPSPAETGDGEDDDPNVMDLDELAVRTEQATQMLRTMAEALPPTAHFARQLYGFAGRVGLHPSGVDILGIVADRLDEARETVASAPQAAP